MALPILINMELLYTWDFQSPIEILRELLRYFTHIYSLSGFLLDGFFQILSLYKDIFLNTVPFLLLTSELPPHSHCFVVYLLQREITQKAYSPLTLHSH
jgi:hypothetical protein